MSLLLQFLQEIYISLARCPTTCFVAPAHLVALEVLDDALQVQVESLEVHLEVHIDDLAQVELLHRGILGNEIQGNNHPSKPQYIQAEVVSRRRWCR